MKKLLLILLFFPWAMLSQEVLVEKTPPDYIKTIIFKALTINRYNLKATLMAPYRVIRTTALLSLMNLPN